MFTEQGIAMLSGILRSDVAVQVGKDFEGICISTVQSGQYNIIKTDNGDCLCYDVMRLEKKDG